MNITVNGYSCPQNHPCPVINFCPADAITQEGFGVPTVRPGKVHRMHEVHKNLPNVFGRQQPVTPPSVPNGDD